MTERAKRPALGPCLAAALLVVLQPARADEVHLVNGRSFEGVLAEVTDSGVRIRFPYGEMILPRSQVAWVEKGETAFEEFLRREEALAADSEAGAGDWLDLALWARRSRLDHGVRRAALMAAQLDPGLDGLAPILRSLGYAFDEELARWIPYEEAMRRRGFVRHQGEWMTAAERAERLRQRRREDEERRAAAEAQALRALETQVLALTALELRRAANPPPPALGYGAPVAAFPGFGVPAFFGLGGLPVGVPHGGFVKVEGAALRHHHHHVSPALEGLLRRPPGSLIPVSHRGGLQPAAPHPGPSLSLSRP